MTPERWQQVDQLFHIALERTPEERAAFLDEACGGDEELRREVESLLAADAEAESSAKAIPAQVAAEMLAENQDQPVAGQSISHYRILSQIGKGGMGEVYLAQDTKLGRKVALKLLPAQFTQDAERVRRFEREARAASALNHPNIITIYEIGENAGRHFIATEFIEGQTLRELMAGEKMSLNVALDTAAQVVNALGAAHAAGVVHRDIKPENIMLRPDGLVKVLDFGLAKLTERQAVAIDTQAPTVPGSTTEPGVVMGTARYMSPEQARGLEVDERSDIFSLGVVIYEMIAGHAPFTGATTSDVIVSILEKEPPPLRSSAPEIPEELELIVASALRKDREERYQTIKDLQTDLKNLKLEPASVEAAKSSASNIFPWGDWRAGRRVFVVSALLIALAVSCSYFWISSKTKQTQTGLVVRSIAVLPFKPLVASARDEILELGMADTLITKLGNLRQLIVRPTSAVRKYTALDQDPLAAGREQRVEAVLESSMHLLGEKIRVTVRLLDVRDGSALWSYQCTEYCTDIFAAQDAISQKVAEALALELTGEEKKRLAKHYTDNLEVYQLYVKGNYFRLKLTEEGYRRSLEYFNQAIEKDPNYTLAYTGLAASYGMMMYQGYMSRQEGLSRRKAAMMKALELDDSLADVHTMLGGYKTQGELEWDWEGGEREYKRALEINPNHWETHHLYANYYMIMGRFDEAIASRRRAVEIDPLSLRSNWLLGADLEANRQYREAIEQLRKTIDLYPNSHWVRGSLGSVLEREGRNEEAIAEYLKAASLSGEPAEVVKALREAYQAAGMRGYWQKKLERLKKRAERQDALLFDIAVIYARLGDKEQAFAWLERAYQERDPSVVHIKNVEDLDLLRSDPRYADLLRRMRLPP